jgi:hypothetical protein
MSNIEASTPMPQYQCHKKVWALKIKKVHRDEMGVGLVFEDPKFAVRAFTNDQLKGKPWPQDGMYLVQYEDGYISFSPADVFEDGYKRI